MKATAVYTVVGIGILLGTTQIGHAAGRPYRTMGPYPWCADYNNMTGNCGFSTYEQCREAASGNGGSCMPNPRYDSRGAGGPPSS
jgi:hypothetical protein